MYIVIFVRFLHPVAGDSCAHVLLPLLLEALFSLLGAHFRLLDLCFRMLGALPGGAGSERKSILGACVRLLRALFEMLNVNFCGNQK